jgi:hypothetical protein
MEICVSGPSQLMKTLPALPATVSCKWPPALRFTQHYLVSNNPSLMCNGQTNALVCNETLIQMSHIKTLKIAPTCFDHQLIIIRELLIVVKITG